MGDGNNIVHSWIRLAAKFDFEFVCACPKGFEPDPATVALANEGGAGKVIISHNPMEVRSHMALSVRQSSAGLVSVSVHSGAAHPSQLTVTTSGALLSKSVQRQRCLQGVGCRARSMASLQASTYSDAGLTLSM